MTAEQAAQLIQNPVYLGVMLVHADFAHGMVGGAAGALFLHRVNASLLQKLFALIVIWSGAAMIFF